MLNRRIRLGRADLHEPDLLIHGDNLDVLADTADGSVDLVYIDPPFGTGRLRHGRPGDPDGSGLPAGDLGPGEGGAAEGVPDGDGAGGDEAGAARGHGAGAGGDEAGAARGNGAGASPGGPGRRAFRDVSGDPDRFVSWLWPCLEHSRRVLAAHGSLFVHLDYRTVHYVKVALDQLFGRNRLVNEIVWCYSVGGRSARAFGRKHDTILWYARGPDYAFFPGQVRVPRRPGSHMRVARDADGGQVQEKTDRRTGRVYRYPVADGKVPEDWWTDIEIINRGAAERTGWPTQKPERLLERIVRAASAEGSLVADWFCGSGTTAVVAQRSGRRFVTVDTEVEAIECAAARLIRAGHELSRVGRAPPDIAVRRIARVQPDAGDRAPAP